MENGSQKKRVVVIQDASREVSSSAIKWAIVGLSLKSGDELTLLGVLHQVNNPSTFSFMGAAKFMGYKSSVDTNSLFGTSPKIVSEHVASKKSEYQNSPEIMHITKLYRENKISFRIKVVAASSPKVAAVEAAMELRATWIILDRQMKKDKKYFMERLVCGISRMKRNDSIELLRGPKSTHGNIERTKVSQSRYVTYNEMLPGQEVKPGVAKVLKENIDDENLFSMTLDDLFSLELLPSSSKIMYQNKNDVMGFHSRKGPPTDTSHSTSSRTLPTCEGLQLPRKASTSVDKNAESLSGTTFHEVNCLPSQFCEDQSSHVQKLAANSAYKTECMEHDEIVNEESEQEGVNTPEEIITYEFANDKPEENVVRRKGLPKMKVKRDFTYDELYAATDGFSNENFLSEGGFGSVYKGRLKDGQWIAVKQHKHASLQGEKEFRSEVHVLSRARHKNVVRLLGSCSKGRHPLLVYEYVCNGSLNIHLSKNRPTTLSWKNRMIIALGVAEGLSYLHRNGIIHRDMRPNNILINHDYQPLLGDFGLAKTEHKEFDHSSEHKVVGTVGYMAPEYAKRGKVSSKSDVYSFGVVLLELITGQTTIDKTLGEASLVGWARPLLRKKKYPELIDRRILDSHDVHELFWMVRVAEKCLHKDPNKRPSMEKVEYALKCIMEGGTLSFIEEFSPTHSSDSSFENSNESAGEEETLHDSSSTSSAMSTSRTEMLDAFPTFSEQPFSRSTCTSACIEGSSSGKKKSKGKPKSPQVLYDEMLD